MTRTKDYVLSYYLILFILSIYTIADDANTRKIKLTLLSTTDLHCHILSYDYFKDRNEVKIGLERTATLIHNARKEFQYTMLFDIGDFLQGNPLADYKALVVPVGTDEIHPMFKAMNYLHYDAAVIGNHEFNYGLSFLFQTTQKANFPLVLANVYWQKDDKPLFSPYVILERTFSEEQLNIGVIGFTPPAIMQWDKAHLAGKVYVEDIVTCARKYIPQMKREGADIIIVLAHSGISVEPYREKMENAAYYLSQLEDIDAILSGHLHREFPGGERFADLQEKEIDNVQGKVNGIPVVMAGSWGDALGIVHLTLENKEDKWKVVDSQSELRYIVDQEKAVAPDPEFARLIADEHRETVAYVNTALGKTQMRISTYFARVLDCAALQLVNSAQIWYATRQLQGTSYQNLPVLAAAAPFKTNFRGEGYTDIMPGEIAIKNIADLYVYPNTLHAVKVNGKILKAWLETAAQNFNTIDPDTSADQQLINPDFPSFNFDVIDGIAYTIDITQPPGERISELKYQGEPISAEREFIVVTNNYRAGGGGNFPYLDGSSTIMEAPDTVREIIINYIRDRKNLTAQDDADNNWKFAEVAIKGRLLFQTSTGVGDILKRRGVDWIVPLEEQEGNIVYRIDLMKRE